jgi:hypothetical protein
VRLEKDAINTAESMTHKRAIFVSLMPSDHQLGRNARMAKADIPLEERTDFRLNVLTSYAMNYQPDRSDIEAVLIEMVDLRSERFFAGLPKAHVAPSVSVRPDSHETVFGEAGAVQNFFRFAAGLDSSIACSVAQARATVPTDTTALTVLGASSFPRRWS